MLIGPGANRLEQRITGALCSGSLHLKESKFLQDICRKIGFYRERTRLSDAQAGWLFTILTSFESGTTSPPSKARRSAGSTRKTPPHSSPENTSESPELMRALAGLDNVSWTEQEPPRRAFDISEALESDSGI
jgi:hypothetical protein